MRIRGTSTKELEAAGEETDGLVESTSKLYSKVKALTAVGGKEGISILGDNGKYLSTYEILTQIADRWEEITQAGNDSALLELLAGKTRGSVVAALLQQPDVLKNAYQDAMNAEGSALRENEKYLDSIQGRIDLLTNSIQTMWKNALDDDVIKNFVNIGTQLVKIIDNLGLIKALFISIGSYTLKKNFGDFLLIKSEPIKQTTSNLKELENAVSQAQKIYSTLPTVENMESLKKAKENLKTYQDELGKTDDKLVDVGNSGQEAGEKTNIGFEKAKAGAVRFGKQMKQMLASIAIMYAVSTLFELLYDSIDSAIDKIKDNSKSAEVLQEKYEKLNNELSNCESELKNLESELEDTNTQIEELISQGTISYTEQEELERLQAISTELERQIEMQKTLQGSLQQGVNAAAINAGNAYLKTSFGSEKSKTERQEEAEEDGKKTGSAWGLGFGAAVGIAIALGAAGFFSGGATWAGIPASLSAGVGTIGISAGIGSAVGSSAGGFFASKKEGIQYDQEQTVENAIKTMNVSRDQLIKARDEAYAAYVSNYTNDDLLDKYEKASEKLSKFDENMANSISQLSQYYNQIMTNWDKADSVQKETARDIGDLIDTYNIAMNAQDAEVNAIERMFGKEADEKIKQTKEQFIETAKAGKEITREDLEGAFGEDFVNRLYEVGTSLTSLIYYFNDAGKAALKADKEISSSYNAVQTIESITDAVNNLKDAVIEFDENGLVSAKTIVELNDAFKNVDGWTEFVNAASSGTTTIEEFEKIASKLAKNKIDDIFSNGNYSAEDYGTLVAQLRNLGVTNATQYANDRILEEALKEVASLADISDEAIQGIADKYGIAREEIDKNIDKLKELSDVQKDYNKKVQEKNNYESWKKSYDEAEEAISRIKKQEQEIDDFVSKWGIDKEALENMISEFGADAEYALRLLSPDTTLTDEEYNKWVEGYNKVKDIISSIEEEYEAAQIKLNNLIEDGIQNGYAERDNQDNLIFTDKDFEADVIEAEKKIKDLENEIETTLTLNIDLQFEFQKKSKFVDDIQSIYDTLIDAAQEYNENGGYMTVDTLQSLLEIDSEYLAALSIENGQLVLNKQALQDVAKARIYDMAIKKIDNMLELASSYAKAGNIEKLNELIGVYSTATGTMQDYNKELLTTIQNELLAQGYSSTDVEGYITSLESKANNILSWAEGVVNNLDSTLSSSGNTAASETESALERLQKRYERQISNLDNQQTYLQNEVNRLEAEHQGISKQYYEDQIAIEQQKLSLYQQERSELLGLLNSTTKGTDEWYDVADALWSVEHNIQEATLNMIEFRQSIIDLYKTAFDDLANAHSNKDDFLSDQQNYIDKYLELLDLQGEVASASGYQEQIAAEQKKMANNVAQLNNLRELLADGMSTGYIKEGSEEWIDMQDQIREVEAAILDNKIALEEYNNELKNLAVEAFNLVRDAFSNKDDFFTTQQDYIEGYIDYLEAIGVDAPEAIYEKLIEIEQEKRKNTLADLVDARQGFKDIEAKGYTAADEEWQDAYSQITELEKKIQDSDIAMAQWEQTIRELNFDKFDRFISRLDDLNSEIEHLRGLMDNEDVAFEDGTWTEEGITSLGLLYQQMQLNQQKSQEYAKKIDELNEEYAKGSMQEQEYYEQLQELKEGQWDAIEAYEDVKDAIVDMEEARIDMVENGINKEIDAYQELIDLKKKELESERDLYEFKKDIEDKTKNIASLERRIASLSGSTNASDIAELRDLMAQLREEQEGLNDTYYSHAKDSQSKALDDEMESFQKSREDYLEALRDTLDDTWAIIEEKISEFLLNADVGLDTLNTTADEHNLTLSDSLMKPWQNAAVESTAFKLTAEQDLQSLINEDGIITLFGNDAKIMLEGVFTAGGSAAILFKSTVNSEIGQIKQIVLESTSPLTANLKFPWEGVIGEDGPINTFSKKAKMAIDEAVLSAQNNSEKMKNYLSSPWNEATTAANTFAKRVGNILDDVVASYKKAGEEISASKVFNPPSYYSGNKSGGSGNNNNNNSALKNYDLDGDGKIMHSVGALRKDATYTIASGSKDKTVKYDGIDYYYSDGLKAYFKLADGKLVDSSSRHATYKFKANTQYYKYYAKGTLGTKKDEWAITDEYGPELTLYPGKDGTLSYMRAGTSVVPADLTKNLMQIGQMNPSELMANNIIKPTVANVATINKDVNISFDALVKADTINEDVLPKVEKIVNEQLNNFARKLNYSLKRVTS